ncbi:hypothetical protein CC1G_06309 [Coprinopsis cinerea okayama7|uniref:Uncharacterized protein n=1 Tax=Coprinopsis cinerea (strain Okayama-7 / 130 / ATCC MYA-4618 / FGSC 9003) TaxID=240176 RepID=A8NTG6_COPC7|nr:hypothetical protein CC1G_06309 [Coprinopsis cinerea okayama7\|eukprot:XP_001836224.2 hypothetical protein CC1G_06309 [Coprinopsis cinerea okayama7\
MFDASACTPEVVEKLSSIRLVWIKAATVAYICYGAVVVLAITSLHLILRGISKSRLDASPQSNHIIVNVRIPIILTTRNVIALVYVLAMTTLSTLAMLSMTRTVSQAIITSGCWNGLTHENWYSAVDKMHYYVFVLTNWGSDGLLVWRCFVIYRSSTRMPVWVSLTLPIVLYLAVVGMGLWFMVPKVPHPHGPHPHNNTGRLYEILYSSLTLSLNILVTLMIVARLLVYRWRLTSILGKSQGSHYTSYVAILIESAVLIVLSNIFLIVVMQRNSPLEATAFQASIQVQAIAPLLIIVRLLQGKAWSPAVEKAISLQTIQLSAVDPSNLGETAPSGGPLRSPSRDTNRGTPIIQINTIPSSPFHPTFNTDPESSYDSMKMDDYTQKAELAEHDRLESSPYAKAN